MGRAVRDARLDKRDARLKLTPRKEPYWRLISDGAHLGYYRGTRAGRWFARFRKPGGVSTVYVKEKLGEADDIRDADGETVLNFRQADEAARAWFAKQVAGTGRPKSFTVGDALDEYVKNYGGKSTADLTSRVRIIRTALGEYQVTDLTAKIVSDWHKERAASPAKLRTGKFATEANTRAVTSGDAVRRRKSTANRDLTVLKAALNRAADHRDWLPVNAWAKVKPFRDVDSAKLRYLADDEARRIVNATDEDFRPMVRAALLTGGRYGELRLAKVRDYDREAKVLWLIETKGGVTRPAYLDEDGVALLDLATAGRKPDDPLFTRPAGEAWGKSHQLRRMTDASQRAKIEKAGFHDLRRSYGARFARKGVPMAVIAEAMGHKDERITRKHYAHLAPSYVSETVRAAVAGLGIVAPSNVKRL